MKTALIVLMALAASAACAANIITKDQLKFLENRRICVRRDTTTIPGSVISYYERNGKPDTKAAAVTTNELKRVTGREQLNPIQVVNEELERVNALLEEEFEKWMEKSQAFSNAVVIANGQLNAANAKIRQEVADLKEEKADLEAKIADSKYILLRPWLKTKLAAVESRIAILESLTGEGR